MAWGWLRGVLIPQVFNVYPEPLLAPTGLLEHISWESACFLQRSPVCAPHPGRWQHPGGVYPQNHERVGEQSRPLSSSVKGQPQELSNHLALVLALDQGPHSKPHAVVLLCITEGGTTEHCAPRSQAFSCFNF